MYFKYIVNSFFKDVKQYSDFNFMDLMSPEENVLTDKYYFFDAVLQFDERFRKRMAYKSYEDREDPFICAMWNMSIMSPITEQSRQFQSFKTSMNTGTAEEFTIKNVQCTFNVVWVSNDPEYLMSFEEYFMVSYDRSITLDTTYEVPVTYQDMGSVSEINQILKTFKVEGEYHFVTIGDTVSIFNSLNNNGSYLITNVLISGGNTTLTTSNSIPSPVVDGTAVKNNGVWELDAKAYLTNIAFSEFNKLEPLDRGEMTFLTSTMDLQYPILMNKTRTNNGGTGGLPKKIIKHIHYKTKTVADVSNVTASDMTTPYEEIIIE